MTLVVLRETSGFWSLFGVSFIYLEGFLLYGWSIQLVQIKTQTNNSPEDNQKHGWKR